MRCENWPTVLNELLEQRRHTPFAWGENDCALFAADVAMALVGVDYAADFRGCYSTAAGSARALAKQGYDSMEQAVTAALGEPVTAVQLKRGDVALFTSGSGLTLGICVGRHIVAPTDTGLQWHPLAACVQGWSL